MTREQELEITAAIRATIEESLAQGHAPQASWLVQRIIGDWDPPQGRDADKWTICGYANVRTLVRQVVRTYKGDADDAQQSFVLDGFTKLHKAYLISRDGEQTIVPVDQLTVEEALGVIVELERNASGLRIHIAEVQRYIDEVLLPRAAAKSNADAATS